MKHLGNIGRFLTLVVIAVAILSLISFCFAETLVVARGRFLPENETWKNESTPLSNETIKDLCRKLSLEKDPLCQRRRSLYAPDFFPAINTKFKRRGTTYQDVQAVLGEYQVELEPIETDSYGKTYFFSSYDIRGDQVTGILMLFEGTYEKNLLMDVRFKYTNKPGL